MDIYIFPYALRARANWKYDYTLMVLLILLGRLKLNNEWKLELVRHSFVALPSSHGAFYVFIFMHPSKFPLKGNLDFKKHAEGF